MPTNNLDEALLSMARTAENCERYEDMCCYVKARVQKFPEKELNSEERNLLSVAYKNVIGARRASWRGLAAELEQLEINETKDEALLKAVKSYRSMVESELTTISGDILGLLKDVLIPQTSKKDSKGDGAVSEEKVFYLKMGGDYYRYLTESVDPENSESYNDYKENTKKYYELAFEEAKHLDPTHPIRLGLALNFSVCKFEILKQRTEACNMAKEAFDEAISKLDQLKENDYKDSTLIMQLLRDNLTLWTSNADHEADD